MKRLTPLFMCAVLVALLVAEAAPAVTVTVENTQGMGVRREYPIATGIETLSQTYDKSYVRAKTDSTVESWGKVWLQYDLSSIWATYGKENLTGASLTIWSENGTGRRFSVAGLLDGLTDYDEYENEYSLESWTMADLSWYNAPGNDPFSGTAVDFSMVYGGAAMWTCQTSSTDAIVVDLAYLEGGTNFDQCARYTSIDGAVTAANTNLLAYLLTDSDGLVTLIGYDHTNSSNQYWWTGVAGYYVGDPVVANGVIRDSPTLELTFIPEPATLAILGLGGLFLRRRLA